MEATATAPELTDALQWLNTGPQRIGALRGRAVALTFWSAGSAYSHNVLRDLQVLQNKHAESLSVIGIHAPKFDAERDAKRVLKAVNRLGLRFPVASDPDFVAWQHYGVQGWPTTVLIDPTGTISQTIAGDLPRQELDHAIEVLLQQGGDDSERDFEAEPPVQRAEPRMPLAFPAGLAVTENHLYIADSGHHRVLECTHEGRILRQFGSANPNFLDGHSAEAGFESPRGLAVWKDALYVADSANHALRRIRLLDGDVDTLLGSGRAGPTEGGMVEDPRSRRLNLPWDVAGGFDRIYLALAGAHQLWELDLGRRQLRCVAGSGEFGLVDGIGSEARLAQPAALAFVQQTLYVADSGASAIRSVLLGDDSVQTLVGHGPYDFGDADGSRRAARLQYPAGLALDARSPNLWIADSGNDQIRMLRLGGGDVRRLELNYRLHHPTALAATPGTLWIANTHAHEILRVDLDSGSVRRLPVGE